MPERTVQLGSMFYIDEHNVGRRGEHGQKIQVHSDFVKRFDSLNVLSTGGDWPAATVVVAPEAPLEEAEPDERPRRGRPPKAAEA